MIATNAPLVGPLTQAEVTAAINPTPRRGKPPAFVLRASGSTPQSRAKDRRAWRALERS